MPCSAGWRVGDGALGPPGISCWVSYTDRAPSLQLLRQSSKTQMVSTELATKDMAFILETSQVSCRGEGLNEAATVWLVCWEPA